VRTRAALFRAPRRALELADVELEEPGADDVLVRLHAVGICGSDLHVVRGEWRRPVPMVLGHEGAGVVEAVGASVSGLAPGDRVVLSWAPACGTCGPCRRGRPVACAPLRAGIAAGTLPDGTTRMRLDGETVYRMTAIGALAERIVVPTSAALPLPSDVSLDEAALIGCAALTGVGAAVNRARVEPGSSVLVVGAGGVGQFVVQGARLAGAARILVVDPLAARREQALGLGATEAADPGEFDAALASLDPEGVDYAFDAVGGAETFSVALRATRGGGTVVAVGMAAAGEKLELDPSQLTNEEKVLTGSLYGSEDPVRALPLLLDHVRAGRLELAPLVGPRFPLERANDALEAALAGRPGRVLVTMEG
jgi:S-(hydroxymethyl)glutathione dehydrogenase/alcohol dehydrogenase